MNGIQFSKLPKYLFVEVLKFLSFDNVINFAKTSKNNHNIIFNGSTSTLIWKNLCQNYGLISYDLEKNEENYLQIFSNIIIVQIFFWLTIFFFDENL